MYQSEQIDGWLGRKQKRLIKKAYSRMRRRLGKKFLEDAPKKNRYNGWST
jgi:hypothetical protein